MSLARYTILSAATFLIMLIPIVSYFLNETSQGHLIGSLIAGILIFQVVVIFGLSMWGAWTAKGRKQPRQIQRGNA